MILIDAIYINSFGGKTILEAFINSFVYYKIDYHFVLDNRLELNCINKLKPNSFSFINASHKNRRQFYLDNINKYSSILCMSNIPPPIKTKIKTLIYFHNRLLIDPFKHEIKSQHKILNFIKFQYIRFYNQKDYIWIVQTPLMKKLLKNALRIDHSHIHEYPFFKIDLDKSILKKSRNSFVYISSDVTHKNHKRLLNAFIKAAKITDKNIELNLSINKSKFIKYNFPGNLKLKFHGTLSKDSVKELYKTNEFAIYPSLVESFGLPLIEAVNYDCKLIASDLPYVHSVVKPSFVFKPHSTKSISEAILESVSTNLPKSEVLIENRLESLIAFVIK